jgi:hypothetical protein
MALGDRQHVEAVAILRRLVEEDERDEDARLAAKVWLRENHPEPEVYIAAIKEAVRLDS